MVVLGLDLLIVAELIKLPQPAFVAMELERVLVKGILVFLARYVSHDDPLRHGGALVRDSITTWRAALSVH